MPIAVVLLSGGLDSYTAAAMLQREGFDDLRAERAVRSAPRAGDRAARAVARALAVRQHLEVRVDLARIGGSALTTRHAVPKDRDARRGRDPVDLRARAEHRLPVAGACLGGSARRPRHRASAPTRSTTPAIQTAGPTTSRRSSAWPGWLPAPASKARASTIHAPLLHMSKAEIIRAGLALGLDYGLTHSCYDPGADGRPCGRCDSCVLRAKGFAEAGAAGSAVRV